jgi:putative ribosome biogenesis GTPase RsgA
LKIQKLEMANYIRHTDAKKMSMVNPYPGLRPYSTRDSQMYFGRSGEVEDVVNHLLKNRFVAITGEPGRGKTSLVNAGIIPALMYQGEWIQKIREKSGKRISHKTARTRYHPADD